MESKLESKLELGKRQVLSVVKVVEFGVYLCHPEDVHSADAERVLLPRKQVPKGAKKGTEIEVFLYRDSQDRLIATTNTPKLQMGELALLKVKETTKIGAFMDWGLEKDLFLPYKEQTVLVKEGREYLVSLYLDKSSRLCATMRLYRYLKRKSPYQVDDTVEGMVYEITDHNGAYVAVDNQYSGRIAKKEIHKSIRVGETVKARVAKVLDDGKLDLSFSQKAYIQMDVDAQLVYETIESYDGVLPFTDKAKPEVIEEELGISKNAFKRAVGRLLKQGKIEIGDGEIRLK